MIGWVWGAHDLHAAMAVCGEWTSGERRAVPAAVSSSLNMNETARRTIWVGKDTSRLLRLGSRGESGTSYRGGAKGEPADKRPPDDRFVSTLPVVALSLSGDRIGDQICSGDASSRKEPLRCRLIASMASSSEAERGVTGAGAGAAAAGGVISLAEAAEFSWLLWLGGSGRRGSGGGVRGGSHEGAATDGFTNAAGSMALRMAWELVGGPIEGAPTRAPGQSSGPVPTGGIGGDSDEGEQPEHRLLVRSGPAGDAKAAA